jgi:hypothetical protein
VLSKGLQIDRSRFRPVGDKQVLQFFDGMTRTLSTTSIPTLRLKHAQDGWATVKCTFRIENDMVHVDDFSCLYPPDEKMIEKDIRNLGVNNFFGKNRN